MLSTSYYVVVEVEAELGNIKKNMSIKSQEQEGNE